MVEISNGLLTEEQEADGNVVVSFVVSGEYECYNKNKPNILCGDYHGSVLTTVHQCPKDTTNYDDFSTNDPTRWFTKGGNEWILKEHEALYYTCGSP